LLPKTPKPLAPMKIKSMDPALESLLNSPMGAKLKEMMGEDPKVKNQMAGFWKFLDNMNESDPDVTFLNTRLTRNS